MLGQVSDSHPSPAPRPIAPARPALPPGPGPGISLENAWERASRLRPGQEILVHPEATTPRPDGRGRRRLGGRAPPVGSKTALRTASSATADRIGRWIGLTDHLGHVAGEPPSSSRRWRSPSRSPPSSWRPAGSTTWARHARSSRPLSASRSARSFRPPPSAPPETGRGPEEISL